MPGKNQRKIQVATCGHEKSGKTALLERFANGKFSETYTRTHFQSFVRGPHAENFSLFDTPAFNVSEGITPNYLNNVEHVIYVLPASVVDRDEEFEANMASILSLQTITKATLYFVISKSDLSEDKADNNMEQAKRCETKLQKNLIKSNINAKCFIASAKNGTGIKHIFAHIETMDKLKKREKKSFEEPEVVKTKSWCCCLPFFKKNKPQNSAEIMLNNTTRYEKLLENKM